MARFACCDLVAAQLWQFRYYFPSGPETVQFSLRRFAGDMNISWLPGPAVILKPDSPLVDPCPSYSFG